MGHDSALEGASRRVPRSRLTKVHQVVIERGPCQAYTPLQQRKLERATLLGEAGQNGALAALVPMW